MAKTPSESLDEAVKPATRKPRAAKADAAAAEATGAQSPAAEAAAAVAEAIPAAKARFSAALDEARANAATLTKGVQDTAEAYREKLTDRSESLIEEAKVLGEQAKERAAALALDGKTRASDALSGLGKIVADNASVVDDKLGAKYGDYTRTAARQIQETAAKLEAKDLAELGDDAKEFVRKSPGLAVGLAAAAGFIMARFFKRSED